MNPTIEKFLAAQDLDRQSAMKIIHAIIMDEDKTVVPTVEPMMGKEMIIYKDRGMMKYGLASVKGYMSLHLLPIYASKALFDKYKALLDKARFQKGCINFESIDMMPLEIVRQLFADCSRVDLVKMREDQLKERKLKSKLKN